MKDLVSTIAITPHETVAEWVLESLQNRLWDTVILRFKNLSELIDV